MPNPAQQRALPGKAYRYGTAGVALVGAGIIAVTPATSPLPDVHVSDIQLTAGEEDIVIDFVRHGDTTPPDAVSLVAGNGLPGFPLSATGEAEAATTATQLANELGTQSGLGGFPPGGVEGIFGGYEQRMIETAEPFLTDQYGPGSYTPDAAFGAISPFFTPLDGFDEIGGGIYAHAAPASIGAYLSELTGLLWVLGQEYVPVLGSNDWNGVQFDENFGGAVDTMYNDAVADPNPVISATNQLTDVVYSGEGAIVGWTLLNVNNPDLAILLPDAINAVSSGELLPPAGVVEVEGNPADGWTLVNFGGQAFPSNPGLLTELFVDVRNLIVAPQTAVWNISQAIFAGPGAPTLTTIEDALSTNLQNVGTAITQFPDLVITDISTEVQNLFTDVAAGQSLSDAFMSTIVGLSP
ncbi:MAG: histidine phosphatase family protein [Mycobacterium sp.]